MQSPTYFRFDYFGFDGTRCVQYRNWRLTIRQALAKFKYLNRFHTMNNLGVSVERLERCGSGWTGDRCSLALHHEGPHNN